MNPTRVLCDYCDLTAVRFVQRGRIEARSFACEEHYHRALYSVTPGDHRLDPPVNSQPEKLLDREEAERAWRTSARFYTVKRKATGLREER